MTHKIVDVKYSSRKNLTEYQFRQHEELPKKKGYEPFDHVFPDP